MNYLRIKNLEIIRFIENTKASEARVRKATIELEKLGKEYRKASIAARK